MSPLDLPRQVCCLLAGMAALAAISAPVAAGAAGPPTAGPVVAELFTSQSCSSCPPADALLATLRRTRPALLVLDFHVDYWNRLGWADPYASAEATARQRLHAAGLGSEVYTPQLVVDGAREMVGSDRPAVEAALAAAAVAKAERPPVALRLVAGVGGLAIQVGAGAGRGELVLVGFDDTHTTRVGSGENGGRTLDEVNVVRSLRNVGSWDGEAAELHVAVPAGQRAAVLLQDDTGRILAAAMLSSA